MAAPAERATGNDAFSIPLEQIDVSDPQLYQDDTWYPWFERLRREAPVHWCRESRYGPYWSVSKYKDIMQVEVNHQTYSSEVGGIAVEDQPKGLERESFIRMDPPKHDEQRKVVGPIVAPANLAEMEATIRERTIRVLDGLPRNETFDWVERVSIELTTMMLATLFDFPWEERRKLTYWSDVAICNVHAPESPVHSEQEKFDEIKKMAERMAELYNERAQQPPKFDLLSMLAHGRATQDMPLREFMGNLTLLIVGGNDTTRNSMTGGLHALSQHPGEYQKLRDDPALVASLVPEIIRYVTPVIHNAAHGDSGRRTRRSAHPRRRQGGDVVCLGQPRPGRDRRSRQFHHRPAAAAPAPVLRLRHPSLRRQSPGRIAAPHPVGGIAAAPSRHRSLGAAAPHLLQLHPRYALDAGENSDPAMRTGLARPAGLG
jgi:hypothetical protein